MSDTPETDEVEAAIREFRRFSGQSVPWSIIKLARELERQRDAYAETLRQTLVLLDSVPAVEQPALLANIIRERHPELGNEKADIQL